ncbi:MAG: tRNA preQ1(34) S-adenosylmethionine ribosyltransferase-isomerase QueA [Candidatus Marinimicrobia bacterium]|nr:tRNA preQ1(34) S-adenosylmethionine ribosyltransferase-isomerase QueA [Candidatus Neomarinimicrobiota bacterium]
MPAFNRVDPILQKNKVHPEDFMFELPEERVPEYPKEPRDASKLMVLNKTHDNLEHHVFSDITEYLAEGDVLVVNNTRVRPAKFQTIKEETGDPIDVTLVRKLGDRTWEISVNPPRKVRIGNSLKFADNLSSDVIDNTIASGRVVQFHQTDEEVEDALDQIGQMPLPPYVQREAEPKDKKLYQSVFGKVDGTIVAPAATLHFTDSLVKKLQDKGVKFAEITLHPGMEKFEQITVSEIAKYSMHSESYNIPVESAEIINNGRKAGHKIIAVGGSTLRAMESSHYNGEVVVPQRDWTDLFIFPPFNVLTVDGLITNFHQPQSPTLLLQCAFLSTNRIMDAYDTALENDYRFRVFGDAMMII